MVLVVDEGAQSFRCPTLVAAALPKSHCLSPQAAAAEWGCAGPSAPSAELSLLLN